MESVEDADSLLVARGQYWTGNRYMDNFLGCSIKFVKFRKTGMAFWSRAASRIPYRTTRKKTSGKLSFLIRSRPDMGSDKVSTSANLSLSLSLSLSNFYHGAVSVDYMYVFCTWHNWGMGKRRMAKDILVLRPLTKALYTLPMPW